MLQVAWLWGFDMRRETCGLDECDLGLLSLGQTVVIRLRISQHDWIMMGKISRDSYFSLE